MGNILRHGIEMYEQTISLKNEMQPLRQVQPKEIKHNRIPLAAGEFLKTSVNRSDDKVLKSESKYRRVAKFLILIGSEQAAEILAELDPEQVNEISKEIVLTKVIKPQERDEILKEFHSLLSNAAFNRLPYRFSGFSRGGIETARRILYAAKGPEKGEELLNKTLPQSKENLFSFLEDFSAEQLVMVLKTETAQATALILSRLPPKFSAEILGKLPPNSKPEILKRMAYQKEVSPEVLEQITAALKEKVRHFSSGSKDIEIDGMRTLAAILKQGDYAFGEKIISELEQTSPDIGKDIKEKLYTLDDIISAIDRPIQEKLKTMSEKDIAVLLKGREKEFSEKILSCVSAGRRKIIREEFDILGAVSKRDCDNAANVFLSWFTSARKNGDIILYSDEDVFL